MSPMNPEELRGFVQRLEILKAWALSLCERHALGQADETGFAEGLHDPASTIQSEANVRVQRPTLHDIDLALQRVAHGLYAVCADCTQVIARERMLVEPAAIRCSACQFKLAR